MTIITTTDIGLTLGPLISKPLLTLREANQLTFSLIELCMESKCDLSSIKLLARYLSTKAYEDLIMERNSNQLCGYPCCETHSSSIKVNAPSSAGSRGGIQLASFYKTSYCSKQHYQCSQFFKGQLSEEALFMRTKLDMEWFADGSFESGIKLLDDHLDDVMDNLCKVSI